MALTSRYTVNSWQSKIGSHIICTRIWILIAQNQAAMMNTWTMVFAKGKHHSSRREQEIIAKPKDSREVEFEVELPGVDARRIFPLLICESQTQLDDFQQVNVTAQELVLIIDGAAEFTDRPDNNPGELRVLRQKGKWSFTMDSTRSHDYHSVRAVQTVKTFTASEEQSMPTVTKTASQNTPQQQQPSVRWKTSYLASDCVLSLLNIKLTHCFYPQIGSLSFYWLHTKSFTTNPVLCTWHNLSLAQNVYLSTLTAQPPKQTLRIFSVRLKRSKKLISHWQMLTTKKIILTSTAEFDTKIPHTPQRHLSFATLSMRTFHILRCSVPKQSWQNSLYHS